LVNTIQTSMLLLVSHVQQALIVELRLYLHQLVFVQLVTTVQALPNLQLLIQLQRVVESVLLDTIVLPAQAFVDFVHQE
jgi:hypothetical protein